MKKHILLIFLIISIWFPTVAQDAVPPELEAVDAKLQELQAQVTVLDGYKPEKTPNFSEMEMANQLVEKLDFSKRMFDLLIKQYNLLEDEIFPIFLAYSKKNPGLRQQLLPKVREYTGKGPKSILVIQGKINAMALLIEHQKRMLEQLQLTAKNEQVALDRKKKAGESAGVIDISTRLARYEEENKAYAKEITSENKRLIALREQEKNKQAKIEEKTAEMKELNQKASQGGDPVERLVNRTFAQNRRIRVNGLEIPQLNTIKTFIYLSETKVETLGEKVSTLESEMISLKKRRTREIQDRFIKGIFIIFIAIFVVFLLNRIAIRVSKKILESVDKSDSVDPHRKQRYNTLSSVTLSFIRILLWVLAVLWVLGELNIDYAPFLVAAGGISLAIGFGAQSLVKDVVSGFFILIEEQFALGDWVEIDGKSGTIEKISLRTVKLRSTDGTLHIIPNGGISRVSNSTHQWSRAVIKLGISYDVDAEKVLEVLNGICEEFYKDKAWEPQLIGKPNAQGILSFGDSAVYFRILAKTLPGEQWSVERELNMRIKKTFDQKGIEIPYNFINIVDRTVKE